MMQLGCRQSRVAGRADWAAGQTGPAQADRAEASSPVIGQPVDQPVHRYAAIMVRRATEASNLFGGKQRAEGRSSRQTVGTPRSTAAGSGLPDCRDIGAHSAQDITVVLHLEACIRLQRRDHPAALQTAALLHSQSQEGGQGQSNAVPVPCLSVDSCVSVA